jgi:uncharacterized protein (DUF3820 family)
MTHIRYTDFKETKVPFGKYKGKQLQNVPESYLKWVILNHSDRGICEMFSVELQRRKPNMRR